MNETFERLFIAAKEIKSIKNKADLARLLNISQQTLKNWESRGISSQGVIESAAILNISTQWLTSGHGQMKNGDSSHAPNNPNHAHEKPDDLYLLTDEHKRFGKYTIVKRGKRNHALLVWA